MEVLKFLLAPFVASLILTGIHAYLGVHVVERGVIFVDIALAQIAALGGTAAIISVLRTKDSRIPQEAIIGITYAVASAAAILAMSKAVGETEHLKDMLVGNILAVSKREVIKTAI